MSCLVFSDKGFISPWILLIFGVVILMVMEFSNQLDRLYQGDDHYSQASSALKITPKPSCKTGDPKDCNDLDEGNGFGF